MQNRFEIPFLWLNIDSSFGQGQNLVPNQILDFYIEKWPIYRLPRFGNSRRTLLYDACFSRFSERVSLPILLTIFFRGGRQTSTVIVSSLFLVLIWQIDQKNATYHCFSILIPEISRQVHSFYFRNTKFINTISLKF